ncbi:MAG: rhodanese-like domain-containing protein [Aliishimia sp.]
MQKILKKSLQIIALAVPMTLVGVGSLQANTIEQNPTAQTQDWSRYITSDRLNALMQRNNGVQIIDIRSKKYVKKGMIPGAVWMPFADWRGPKERPGQPPTEEELEAMLGANGLRLDQPIVVHNQSGKTLSTGRAAIVYWILKSSGADNIAILNGGFKAWQSAELPEAITPITPAPIDVDLTIRRDWWADPVHIFGVASSQSKGAILDARLEMQVKKSAKTGKPLQSMPMAQYISASFFINQLSTSQLSASGQDKFVEALEARGIQLDDGFLISVCQTGELSALSWFYASEIVGLENVLYYPDALQGWRSDGGLMFGLNTETGS